MSKEIETVEFCTNELRYVELPNGAVKVQQKWKIVKTAYYDTVRGTASNEVSKNFEWKDIPTIKLQE